MRATVLVLLISFLLVPSAPATAQEAGDQGGDTDDIVIFDGPVTVPDRVTGDVVAFSGGVTIPGTVDGDVVVFSGPAVLEPRARVRGDLIYGEDRPLVPGGASVAGDVRQVDFEALSVPFNFAGRLVFWLAFSVSSLALGLLLLWLGGRAGDAAFETARARFGPAVGWGLALFFGLPIVAVLALVTLVGIPLGVALLLALVPLYAVGYSASAWLLGRTLLGPPRARAISFLAGWGILRLAALIPFVAGLAWFAATVFGLGVLLEAARQARRPPPRVAPAAGA
jgi:hypothetical protein